MNSKSRAYELSVRKTYEQVKRQLELYDRLISFGIPKEIVHFYTCPERSSGYSVAVMCNGQKVQIIDWAQEYAMSSRRRAYHGYLVYNFTKKALKEYVQICYSIIMTENPDTTRSLERKRYKLIEQSFDAKNSDIKER